jgi:hypothetical protein
MIIILSGPPKCGKDTAYKFLKKQLIPPIDHAINPHTALCHYRLGQPMKDFFHSVLKIRPQTYDMMMQKGKDNKQSDLNDHTPREVQIKLFTDFLKPMFGADILGKIAVEAIKQKPYAKIVLDSGTTEELVPIIQHFGKAAIRALKITRPNCDYTGDSRSEIDFEALGIQHDIVDNKYDLELYEIQIQRILKKWGLIQDEGS